MKKIFSYLSFTKNETRVILFLITVLTAGFALKYYREILNTDASVTFDFSKQDAEFRQMSLNAQKNQKFINGNLSEDSLIKFFQLSDDSIISSRSINNDKSFPEKSINVNTAAKEELVDLPGIGESIAERIILYREEKNGFRSIDELLKVKGIGKKKFEKLKIYIKAE